MLETSVACWMLHNTQCAMSYELGGQYWDVWTKRIAWMIYTYTTFGEYCQNYLTLFIHFLFVSLFTTNIHIHVNIWLVLNQEESSTVIDRLTLWIQVVDSTLTVKDFLLTFMLCSHGSVICSMMRRVKKSRFYKGNRYNWHPWCSYWVFFILVYLRIWLSGHLFMTCRQFVGMWHCVYLSDSAANNRWQTLAGPGTCCATFVV